MICRPGFSAVPNISGDASSLRDVLEAPGRQCPCLAVGEGDVDSIFLTPESLIRPITFV
jgi:hypothetical protein